MCAEVNMSRIFFFKQKTAYEIKECDWSSDVCSSDLYPERADLPATPYDTESYQDCRHVRRPGRGPRGPHVHDFVGRHGVLHPRRRSDEGPVSLAGQETAAPWLRHR